MAATVCWAGESATSPLRSFTTTLAPAAAKASAWARPKPAPAPVTTATLPCNLTLDILCLVLRIVKWPIGGVIYRFCRIFLRQAERATPRTSGASALAFDPAFAQKHFYFDRCNDSSYFAIWGF